MSNKTLALDDRLYDYLLSVSLREPDVLARLREETLHRADAEMQIAPEQGQFMALLLKLIGARRSLEVGTFTGYSALVCALALPEDGQLVALDINEETTAIAQRYWAEAGVENKIELRLGPAEDSLRNLIDGGDQGSFDFMFIDADKTGYPTYYEMGLQLLRPGGVLAFDNVLWAGRVADPGAGDDDTQALRALNVQLHADPRVDISMVPIGDGLTLARKLG
ncbi:MAG: class I SAM-dependent methyltransferase [Gammaproteobacteria bacterium]|jgi:predicted O-methyltransferase YrrM